MQRLHLSYHGSTTVHDLSKGLSMNTFRFNPVFNQWVLLGAPTSQTFEITDRHILDIGKTEHFVAATIPRQPFLLDPPTRRNEVDDLLYKSQPPLGEAEVLLYKGEKSFDEWTVREWDGWLMLLQQRLMQVYHNPHLHFAQFTFSPQYLDTVGPEFLRVGELISTSHQVAGSSLAFTAELLEKLRQKEDAFIVLHTDGGDIYVPSAPLFEKEAWILPTNVQPSFEAIEKEERSDFAHMLKTLFMALHTEFPSVPFVLTLHTALEGMSPETTWWMQIHQKDNGTVSSIGSRPLPEAFARHLEFALLRKP